MVSHVIAALLVLAPLQSAHDDLPLSIARVSIAVEEAMIPDADHAPEPLWVTPIPHPLPTWPGVCPPTRPWPWPPHGPWPWPCPGPPWVFEGAEETPSPLPRVRPSGIY